MNAEPEFLASAYLDGELTDDERRIAEADPAVMAEVEQLRALRAELTTPPPPSDAAREAAIAAAMAEFGRRREPLTAPVPVVPYRPRPAWSGWLSAAAAVLVIGVLGIAVVAGVRSGGDDDSASDEPAMDAATAEEPADDGARMTEAAPADGDATADEPAMDVAEEPAEMADVMVDDAGAEEPAAEEPAAEEPAAEEPAAEEPAMDAPAEEPADEPADLVAGDPVEYLENGRAIVTADELTVIGAYLAELVDDRAIGATPEHACPFPNVLDTAEVVDDRTGERRPVYLDVAPDVNLVTAVDQESCDVLLDAPLVPEP